MILYCSHNEPVLTAVFDHMMNGIVEMSKCTVAQKQGENLFEVYKELFKEMAENVVSVDIILLDHYATLNILIMLIQFILLILPDISAMSHM